MIQANEVVCASRLDIAEVVASEHQAMTRDKDDRLPQADGRSAVAEQALERARKVAEAQGVLDDAKLELEHARRASTEQCSISNAALATLEYQLVTDKRRLADAQNELLRLRQVAAEAKKYIQLSNASGLTGQELTHWASETLQQTERQLFLSRAELPILAARFNAVERIAAWR